MTMVSARPLTGQADDAPFAFRSDRLALDFAATLMFREPRERARELLGDARALARWAVAAGLVDDTPSGVGAFSLDEATGVREAIHGAARALVGGEALPAESLVTLNAHAARRPVTVTLARDGALARSGSLQQVLASLARDAIELFGGPDSTRVRQCARAGCTRLFVDRTRAQSRVWCGMRECGNRVNAAAYRRRRAGGG
jgi:predicted RNA-binding Zn ribbon-like protein